MHRARRKSGMTKLIVDGKEIDVPPEYTLLQACEAACNSVYSGGTSISLSSTMILVMPRARLS